MAYTCDLRDVSTDNSTNGWAELSGHTAGGAQTLDADYYIQGINCISQALGTKTGTVYGLQYDNGSNVTYNTGEYFFFWQVLLAANAIGDWTSNTTNIIASASGFGMLLGIGSTIGNIRYWKSQGANVGRNPYGGWQNIAINPVLAGDDTEGTPVTGNYRVFASMPNMVSAVTKGNVHGVDIIRVGRGRYDITGTGNNFAGLAADNDSQNNRYGLFQAIAGGYLWKGLLSFGSTTTSCTFSDSNKSIIIDNCPRTSTSFNRIEIRQAGTIVDLNSILIAAPPASEAFPGETGILARGEFEVIDNATVTITGCSFIDMSTFIFLSNTTISGTTFRRCDLITPNGATITSSLITNSTSTTAYLTSSAANFNNKVTNVTFNKDTGFTTPNAVDIGTINTNTTLNWNNISLTGTNASAWVGTAGTNISSTTNGAVKVTFGSNVTLTISVTGESSIIPTVEKVGTGTVNIESNVTNTVTVVDVSTNPISGAQVGVYTVTGDTELFNNQTNGSGVATFSSSTNVSFYVRVRKSTTGTTRYIPVETTGSSGTTGVNITITLTEDILVEL